MDQKKERSRHKNQTPSETKTVVDLIRHDYEKRMLMAALIGGISETMIWELVFVHLPPPSSRDQPGYCYTDSFQEIIEMPVRRKETNWTAMLHFWLLARRLWRLKVCTGCVYLLSFCKLIIYNILVTVTVVPSRENKAGWGLRNKKLSDLWKAMSEDQQNVFKDPFFFALAGLPDLSLSNECHVELEDEDGETNEMDHPAAQVSAPKFHQLSAANDSQYWSIFESVIDVEKVHTNHGKPESTDSTANVQLKSSAAFRAAHHDVSGLLRCRLEFPWLTWLL